MRLRAILLALLLGSTVHVAMAIPAAACSCFSPEPGEKRYMVAADAIFVGEILDYAEPQTTPNASQPAAAGWTFQVSDVYKGAVAATQDVVSALFDGSSCGAEFPHSGRVLVFASSSGVPTVPGPVLYSGMCDGSRALVGPAPAELGDPRTPPALIAALAIAGPIRRWRAPRSRRPERPQQVRR